MNDESETRDDEPRDPGTSEAPTGVPAPEVNEGHPNEEDIEEAEEPERNE